ncbi:MAG: DUF3617 domain-containing protein [Brevundimonas sp.]|uniref:DUF3617 domain-containing protein n=1 Tax=Brevundimonas sp. TaxID=1871086 RepID=UPI0039192C89
MLSVLALTGCGGETAGPVQPGEWEITSTTGAPNGGRINRSVTKRCLRSRQDDPTREIVLELIARDSCEADRIVIADGQISGALQCPEYYSFSAHEEPVAGRYAVTTVGLTVDMPLFGHILRHEVKAKRIGKC